MGYSFYNVREGVYNHRSITGRLMAAAVAVLFGVSIAATMAAQAATPVVVTADDKQGWEFFDDNRNGGAGSFVVGPEDAPLGNGSAQLEVAQDDQGFAFGTAAYGGTLLSDITELSYDTYVQQGNETTAPSLQFSIDADSEDDNDGWQGRLVYEPYHAHDVIDGRWQSWNTLDNADGGNWWFSNGNVADETGCAQANPCTWEEVTSSSSLQNATINANDPQVLFKAGSGWTNFVGNIDNFTIGVNDQSTTYDFEAEVVDTTDPVVELTNPEEGDELNGTVTLEGTVSDENNLLHRFIVRDSDNEIVYNSGNYQNSDETINAVDEFDTTQLEDGAYRIILFARDVEGNTGRDIANVLIDNRADNKDECKDGGWVLGLDLDREFRNQGDCVSHFSSETQETRNPDGARNQNARR